MTDTSARDRLRRRWASRFHRHLANPLARPVARFLRNIAADPRVRLQLRGRWHRATAHLLDDDDARHRLGTLPAVNSAIVRMLGTDLLTVRIDLDGDTEPEAVS